MGTVGNIPILPDADTSLYTAYGRKKLLYFLTAYSSILL